MSVSASNFTRRISILWLSSLTLCPVMQPARPPRPSASGCNWPKPAAVSTTTNPKPTGPTSPKALPVATEVTRWTPTEVSPKRQMRGIFIGIAPSVPLHLLDPKEPYGKRRPGMPDEGFVIGNNERVHFCLPLATKKVCFNLDFIFLPRNGVPYNRVQIVKGLTNAHPERDHVQEYGPGIAQEWPGLIGHRDVVLQEPVLGVGSRKAPLEHSGNGIDRSTRLQLRTHAETQ